MRNTRADVVEAALQVLDGHGLEYCSMRRVAAALEVQPSALYHHVPNKQTLLALMADEIVGGVVTDYREYCERTNRANSGGAVSNGTDPSHPEIADGHSYGHTSSEDPAAFCRLLRHALLAVRDGADVVATAIAFRLGGSSVEAALAEMVGTDGARTLLLYTFGQAQATQTELQAYEIGALPKAADPRTKSVAGVDGVDGDAGAVASEVLGDLEAELDRSFDRGIAIILAGLHATAFTTAAAVGTS